MNGCIILGGVKTYRKRDINHNSSNFDILWETEQKYFLIGQNRTLTWVLFPLPFFYWERKKETEKYHKVKFWVGCTRYLASLSLYQGFPNSFPGTPGGPWRPPGGPWGVPGRFGDLLNTGISKLQFLRIGKVNCN